MKFSFANHSDFVPKNLYCICRNDTTFTSTAVMLIITLLFPCNHLSLASTRSQAEYYTSLSKHVKFFYLHIIVVIVLSRYKRDAFYSKIYVFEHNDYYQYLII